MPTIDQLPGAIVSADSDLVPVSQAGFIRSVSRAQLVAGMQPTLAVPQGTLLGRSIPGVGAPEPVSVGANLVLRNNTLSAVAAPFFIDALPGGTIPVATDRVAMVQDGTEAAVAYGEFMAGLQSVPGIDGSGLVVKPSGATSSRSLAVTLADALPVEAFGAAGDGFTDDTAALAAAVESGKPVRLGPKTYIINGQWTIATSAILLGVPGSTVLQRASQSGDGAWISIQGPSFAAFGIVFDANRGAVAQESWGVLVTASCSRSEFDTCTFTGGQGVTQGNGLTLLASDPDPVQHVVRNCDLFGNSAHGLWVQAVGGVQVLDNRAHDNGAYGICLDYNDATFTKKVRLAQVLGNRCWNNLRGISVGNYNATNTQPPVWGNDNPDALDILIAGNTCHQNQVYGIAAAGARVSVQDNLLSGNGSTSNGGAGLLANVSCSRICGNTVTGASQYGIDSGGSLDSDISNNHVSGAVVGINPGGSQRVRVSHNFLKDCIWAVTVYNIETDGQGENFGISTDRLTLSDNWISIPGPAGGGIYLIDAPQNVSVLRNTFVGGAGSSASQAVWAHTDSITIEGNSWNNQARCIANPAAVGPLQQVQVPDIADEVMITSAPQGVQSMVTQHAAACQGRITFVKVTAGGVGYTSAAVAIAGAGHGAAAVPYISGGKVIGIAVTNAGQGYDAAGATAVTITGDGSGATAVASVGLPVWEQRRLRVSCNCPVRFARVGSSPFQENWTQYDLSAPANTIVEWLGVWGAWRAVQFPGCDYLDPLGDGSLVVRSSGQGDLTLRPAGGGRVRIGSDAEPWGYISCIGHGSPLGVVTAPPGSDYRNLDGGAGKTLWIKQSGQDASGWVAIA